eukprot:CAMPEP_0171114906 /NCGR_PEP_ID=MMETSP0766_2-20121228/86448_1 /TAXON_ID=439317 /ORGANISM="Gambierdiscus australes, Strain CAWD 149" /LENGTH=76 /DNA_ID=CAMNT_0011577221 /DNA_START=18 /DNA_END=244 /DNA_ORIENTATION=+
MAVQRGGDVQRRATGASDGASCAGPGAGCAGASAEDAGQGIGGTSGAGPGERGDCRERGGETGREGGGEEGRTHCA